MTQQKGMPQAWYSSHLAKVAPIRSSGATQKHGLRRIGLLLLRVYHNIRYEDLRRRHPQGDFAPDVKTQPQKKSAEQQLDRALFGSGRGLWAQHAIAIFAVRLVRHTKVFFDGHERCCAHEFILARRYRPRSTSGRSSHLLRERLMLPLQRV